MIGCRRVKQINELLVERLQICVAIYYRCASAYSEASGALGEAIDRAFSEDDTQQIAVLRQLLVDRIAKEQEILGQLDLVGRG
ncbi:MAG: hypothetical protein Ct9H90mP5_04070 [Acidimicrobiaceae bacterium]|nr:MAG: hypothetical protein Ct9H90mP5_04070 [Acidimicrobiaceae bacterium]